MLSSVLYAGVKVARIAERIAQNLHNLYVKKIRQSANAGLYVNVIHFFFFYTFLQSFCVV